MNPYLALAAIGALLVSFAGGGILGWHERTVRVPAELTEQQGVDAKECQQAQQLTKGANDALQKDRDTIAAQLNAYQLLHPPTCVRLTGPANNSSGGAEHAAGDGESINTGFLRSYAAKCEEYRGQVKVCSDFLVSERKFYELENGQQPELIHSR